MALSGMLGYNVTIRKCRSYWNLLFLFVPLLQLWDMRNISSCYGWSNKEAPRLEVKRRGLQTYSTLRISSTPNIFHSGYRCANRMHVLGEENGNGDSGMNHLEFKPENVADEIYRPFAMSAWSKLQSSGLLENDEVKNDHSLEKDASSNQTNFLTNSSPMGGKDDSAMTSIEIRSARGLPSSPIRLVRHALIESTKPSGIHDNAGVNDASNNDQKKGEMMSSRTIIEDGTHVLNLVIFPRPTSSALPIFGADLVTLPGGRHLIAIDFQPVLPSSNYIDGKIYQAADGGGINGPNSFPRSQEDQLGGLKRDFILQQEQHNPQQKIISERLANLHAKYVTSGENFIWGGKIPDHAARFFSKHAIWTRFVDSKGANGQYETSKSLDIVRTEIYSIFCDYFDLYLEMMITEYQSIKEENGESNQIGGVVENDADVLDGHRDYISYREANDPARPMLCRLYGKKWAEDVITCKLFPMI
mmetsp:Transcript_1327/g.1910  ORF Transcript_1327/g.1910 Transcript_1327/m.1910 type:complete len:473 (+) Transcript_1327:65-1483(+)